LSACDNPAARSAAKARADLIRGTAGALRAECQAAAGGDWEHWQRDTACYRAALKAKVAGLKCFKGQPVPPGQPPRTLEASYEALEGKDDFPLFEIAPAIYIRYLHDPDYWQRYRDRPVVAANRWLRRRGIDLIFVPVPKMTEVYVEHFLDACPTDGVIAPHVRRALLDLLEEDVEIVDGFSLFRSARDADPEYLYNAADSHWAPRATRLMAKELAHRIERYDFGAKARRAPPVTSTVTLPFDWPQNGLEVLSRRQRERAEAANPANCPRVYSADGKELRSDAGSPVLVIGHSYVNIFGEQLVKELNLLTNTRTGPGFTTEFFVDFVREPELLDHCKVVIWITTEMHMPEFLPLPPSVAATLKES
jgi:hypothetical protein